MGPGRSPRLLVALGCCICVVGARAGVAAASGWVAGLNPGGSGQAHAQAAPSTPSGVTATCTTPTGKTVTVTWAATVSHASYTVYQGSSSTGPWTQVATGVSATTWTTGNLSNGKYFYSVKAYIGSNWTTAQSAATAQRTISSSGCA